MKNIKLASTVQNLRSTVFTRSKTLHALSLGALILSSMACRTRNFGEKEAAKSNSFVSSRKSAGFEGFALLAETNPFVSADSLFRILGNDAPAQVRIIALEKFPTLLAGVTWRLELLGDRMTEFVLVPSVEGNLTKEQAKELSVLIKNLKLRNVKEVVPLFTEQAYAFTKGIELSDSSTFESIGKISTSDPDWTLKRTRTSDVHEMFKNKNKLPGEGVIVGVIDTGTTNHPELVGTKDSPNPALDLSLAWDFEKSINNVINELKQWGALQNPNHGTSTASMLISPPGKQNTADKHDVSVTGSAWGAKLIPVKIGNSVVAPLGWRLSAAVNYLTDKNAKVISMSVGTAPTPFILKAVQRAAEEGVIIVAAAGTGIPMVIYPARFDEVVSVASVDLNCKLDPQSAHGNRVDVSAPGTDAWIAWTLAKENETNEEVYLAKRAWGTSLATPQVAGAAALWLSHHGWDSLASKYGKKNIWRVFKHVLKSGGVSTAGACGKLAAAGYGAGLLDTKGLIEAKLPALEDL